MFIFWHAIKLLRISLIFIVIVALLSLIFGFFVQGSFTLRYIFDANYTIGIAVILSGFFYKFFPSSMLPKGDKLFDHTSFAERSFKVRKRRQALAVDILLVGINIIVITGLIQFLLSVIV